MINAVAAIRSVGSQALIDLSVKVLGLLGCTCFLASAIAIGDEPALIGSSSCATATCHGNVVGRGPSWNHAHSTFTAKDPHAGAGLLLLDADSREIVRRLDPKAAVDPFAFDRVLRSRCISCHATAAVADTIDSQPIASSLLAAGVSCESCHGAAESWVDAHLLNDWVGEARFQPAGGMRDTESILGRARGCVRCHVGSRTEDSLVRDMNHDLIAAGHPALRFDLLLYNENLPQHWSADNQSETKFNASAMQVRQIGRVAGLAASSRLAAERIEGHSTDPTIPIPEFSDYDCFACHQSLSIEQFNLPPAGSGGNVESVSIGLPIWNAWHTSGQIELAGNRARLQALAPGSGVPQKVASIGRSFAERYSQKAEELASGNATKTSELIVSTFAKLESDRIIDWSQAATILLDLDAALRDLNASDPEDQKFSSSLAALEQAEKLLRFDSSRRPGQRSRWSSPKDFDSTAFKEAVLAAFGGQLPEL